MKPTFSTGHKAALAPDSPSSLLVSTSCSLQQARSVILGAAIGDALGVCVEALDAETIFAGFGPQGVQELAPDGAFYSDDTQMSMSRKSDHFFVSN